MTELREIDAALAAAFGVNIVRCSTDLADAGFVVQRLRERGLLLSLTDDGAAPGYQTWLAEFCDCNGEREASARGETPQEAISRAALAALEDS